MIDPLNPYGLDLTEPAVWLAPHFSCNCLTGISMHPKGTFCIRCHLDRCTIPPARWLDWVDEFGSNGLVGMIRRAYFDGREDRELGIVYAGGTMGGGKVVDGRPRNAPRKEAA